MSIYCPAMDYKERDKFGFEYPFGDGAPRIVQLTKDVQSSHFYAPNGRAKLFARAGEKYNVWVNSYGAVSVVLKNGKKLGLLPGEYVVTNWHTPSTIEVAQAERLKQENE